MSHLQGSFVYLEQNFSQIGERIRSVRGGLTQAAFAERLDVARKTIVRWEAGEALPDGASLLAFVQHFGVDPRWLLVGTESNQPVVTAEEQRVLALYRLAPAPVRQAVLAALAVGEMAPAASSARSISGGQVVIHPGGSVGHVVDASRSQGGVKLGDVYMGAPAKKKGK